MRLENYLCDGACWQAVAVMAYLRGHYILPDFVYNNEHHYYEATADICRFDNCREQGYVLMIRYYGYQKNYAFYEHRNSDRLCVVAFEKDTFYDVCHNDVMEAMKDKWDFTKSFSFGEIVECGSWIVKDIETFLAKCKEEREEKMREKEEEKLKRQEVK